MRGRRSRSSTGREIRWIIPQIILRWWPTHTWWRERSSHRIRCRSRRPKPGLSVGCRRQWYARRCSVEWRCWVNWHRACVSPVTRWRSIIILRWFTISMPACLCLVQHIGRGVRIAVGSAPFACITLVILVGGGWDLRCPRHHEQKIQMHLN